MPDIVFTKRGKYANEAPAASVPAPLDPPRAHSAALTAYLARSKAKRAKNAEFQPSPQQNAYFDWIKDSSGNLILRARAGTGKTTTLLRGLRFMQGMIFLGAYNKDIAAEMKAKATELGLARSGMFIGTMHGAGYSDFSRTYKNLTVDDGKVRRLVDGFAQELGNERAKLAKGFICTMVSFGKQYLIGCDGKPRLDNFKVWENLCYHFSAEQSLVGDIELGEALPWVMEVFRRSHAQCPTIIDFDDMIYAPIAYNVRIFKNDWVLIDECQDVNPARREYARRLLKPGTGRLVAVGDDKQAIYGFTGAGGDAITLIKEEFNCAELPLSVTYRCPKKVVEFLHDYVADIEAHDSAIDGEVREVHYMARQADGKQDARPWFVQDAPSTSDVILCRYNSPLLTTAFAMIREGITCKVAGRDIGKGLIALARSWKITKLTTLRERLAEYLIREVAKAKAKESERAEREVIDKVECLYIFIARCQGLGKALIEDMVADIEAMFSDQIKDMITLSSGHKSKGKEWPRVFWLRTAHRGRSQKAWEAEQEDNLEYVIGSRVQGKKIEDEDGELVADPNTGTLVMVAEGIHSPKREHA